MLDKTLDATDCDILSIAESNSAIRVDVVLNTTSNCDLIVWDNLLGNGGSSCEGA